jgi:hypothetical protein
MRDPEQAIDVASVADSVRRWVESVVIDLHLCPFAERELMNNRVRFQVTDAANEEQLLVALADELRLLGSDPAIETTLLIHPNLLQDFYDYNQFLDHADRLLVELHLDGVYQIASFHPEYRFAGTDPSGAENYTNRSPYPMLHIIREESLERAIADYPDIDQVPIRNVELMQRLGIEKLKTLLAACRRSTDTGKSGPLSVE